MTITVTDLFAGAGGSSTGMTQIPGIEIRIAANHWQLVTDIHNLNHPDTDHAVVDLHQERPSFFPKTDVLWASPECTKWSQASGTAKPAIEEGLFEDPLSDDAKTRSRLLMFDVLKFIEYHRYRLVIVENVVDIATQAKYRTAWTVWREELRALGYAFRVISLNSMHAQLFGAPAPQSRDRIYVVAWPEGEKAPDLDRALRPHAPCSRCNTVVESVQSFKPGRTVGRYKQAYIYCCAGCGKAVEPFWLPAAAAIDWSLPGERIGDREKPLADKTLARIAAGIARYWGDTFTLEAAGNTYDAADPAHRRHGDPEGYMRAWPTTDPLMALHTTNSKGLAVPVEGRDGKAAHPVEQALRTQTTRLETGLAQPPFVAEMYGTSTARPVTEPAGTFTAGGNHHALVMSYYSRDNAIQPSSDPVPTITTEPRHALLQPFVTQFRERTDRNLDPAVDPLHTLVADGASHALVQPYFGTAKEGKPASEPLGTLTTVDRYALVMDNQHSNRSRPVDEAMPTLTTATTKALVHRHNGGGAEMTTPVDEELRTLTTGGNVSLLEADAHDGPVTREDVFWGRWYSSEPKPEIPKPKVTAASLAAAREMVSDVRFRMFVPAEVAAGMAFPTDYKWQPPNRLRPVSNRDLVKAAGNAVTPPSARDLLGVAVVDLMGAAA